jgi:hypothetical protein
MHNKSALIKQSGLKQQKPWIIFAMSGWHVLTWHPSSSFSHKSVVAAVI